MSLREEIPKNLTVFICMSQYNRITAYSVSINTSQPEVLRVCVVKFFNIKDNCERDYKVIAITNINSLDKLII